MPVIVALGACAVTAALMHARAEIALARQQDKLAEAKALLATEQRVTEERIRATEEATRRRALDEFLGDVRIEERQYLKEERSAVSKRTALVVCERVCFRNIPLTGWVERELPASAALRQPVLVLTRTVNGEHSLQATVSRERREEPKLLEAVTCRR